MPYILLLSLIICKYFHCRGYLHFISAMVYKLDKKLLDQYYYNVKKKKKDNSGLH